MARARVGGDACRHCTAERRRPRRCRSAGLGIAPCLFGGETRYPALTVPRSFFPGLNAGAFEAGMAMVSPVAGSQPWRAALGQAVKVPNPAMMTVPPFVMASTMVETKAETCGVVGCLGNECPGGNLRTELGLVHAVIPHFSGFSSRRRLSRVPPARATRKRVGAWRSSIGGRFGHDAFQGYQIKGEQAKFYHGGTGSLIV